MWAAKSFTSLVDDFCWAILAPSISARPASAALVKKDSSLTDKLFFADFVSVVGLISVAGFVDCAEAVIGNINKVDNSRGAIGMLNIIASKKSTQRIPGAD